MMTTVLIVAVAVLGWAAFAYNRLVRLRNHVRTAWADIDVQLKRRHDLVPQLVGAVEGYAGHERGVLTAVTELRAQNPRRRMTKSARPHFSSYAS